MTAENGKGRGVKVTAVFKLNHPDMKPMGDVDGTMVCMRATHPHVGFLYEYVITDGQGDT
ncbi:MAG: hypothetical protein GTN70_07490 [Deltaproteobacteria bacterium]|nr:hypothetical protein [Deltaproteobacteria bacterium]NIS77539.1 hypothetical protein [Deltaproteobacteria bacterium]